MINSSSEKTNGGLAVIVASLTFLAIISILWAILTYFPSFTGAITPKESALTDLGNAIVVFSFAALALQSSLGIFVSNWRGNESKIKTRRVNNLKEEIADIKALINPTPVLTTDQTSAESPTPLTQPSPTTNVAVPVANVVVPVGLSPEELAVKKKELENFKQLLEQAEDDLAKYREETKAVVSRLSLLAGILISLAGVRILQSFADISLEGKQLSLLNTIDVLLTGGLLAGGSEGVYRLTKVYEDVTDVNKKVSK